MHPKQQHICVQMEAVQMYGTGTFKWTHIQIKGESPFIWTVQNKHQFTVNLDVTKTSFGLWSLYEMYNVSYNAS